MTKHTGPFFTQVAFPAPLCEGVYKNPARLRGGMIDSMRHRFTPCSSMLINGTARTTVAHVGTTGVFPITQKKHYYVVFKVEATQNLLPEVDVVLAVHTSLLAPRVCSYTTHRLFPTAPADVYRRLLKAAMRRKCRNGCGIDIPAFARMLAPSLEHLYDAATVESLVTSLVEHLAIGELPPAQNGQPFVETPFARAITCVLQTDVFTACRA